MIYIRDQYYSSLYLRSEILIFQKIGDQIERYYLRIEQMKYLEVHKTTDQHIDHYIAFYDINYKLIDLVLIPIKSTKRKTTYRRYVQ